VLILPVSIVRWRSFREEEEAQTHGGGLTTTARTPPAATFAAVAIYALSGAVNAALILSTRPNLLLFKRDPFVTSPLGRPPFDVPVMNAQLSLHLEGLGNVGRLPDLPKTHHGWENPTVPPPPSVTA
jgi:hypothetical protein